MDAKVTDEDVLRKVNNDKQILNATGTEAMQAMLVGHVLRRDGLLHDITQRRMNGKQTEKEEYHRRYMV